jgi:hypothetical protein
MAAPKVGEQLVVQDPLEGPEQDSGQVALYLMLWCGSGLRLLLNRNRNPDPPIK